MVPPLVLSSRTEDLSTLPSQASLASWLFIFRLMPHGHKMADVAPDDTLSFQLPTQEGREWY